MSPSGLLNENDCAADTSRNVPDRTARNYLIINCKYNIGRINILHVYYYVLHYIIIIYIRVLCWTPAQNTNCRMHLKITGALRTVNTRGRGLCAGLWCPMGPKLIFLLDGITSPRNYGWLFVFINLSLLLSNKLIPYS
jgi:hypothetical protein